MRKLSVLLLLFFCVFYIAIAAIIKEPNLFYWKTVVFAQWIFTSIVAGTALYISDLLDEKIYNMSKLKKVWSSGYIIKRNHGGIVGICCWYKENWLSSKRCFYEDTSGGIQETEQLVYFTTTEEEAKRLIDEYIRTLEKKMNRYKFTYQHVKYP